MEPSPQLSLFPEAPPQVRGRARRRGQASASALNARRSATTLDRVHAAMLLQTAGRAEALRALLRAEQERGPDFLRLANSLSALYPARQRGKASAGRDAAGGAVTGGKPMPKIEGIRIRNYRVLKDITLGKLWNTQQSDPLTPMTAVIGKNGVGKSSLFDAFGFLADCLKLGVEEACDARGRGGFERIRSQGAEAPIAFEVYYREDTRSRPITYEFAIDTDDSGRPYVLRERLRQRRRGQRRGWPFSFLMLNDGAGSGLER